MPSVGRRAISLVARIWPTALAVAVAKASALALLCLLALTLAAWLSSTGQRNLPAWGRLYVLSGYAVVAGWSILSSLQRAALIAAVTDPHTGPKGIGAAFKQNWAPIAAVACTMAIVDCIVVTLGVPLMLTLPAELRFRLGLLAAWYMAIWLFGRGLVGLAMASAVREGPEAGPAVNRGFGAIRGYRWRNVGSRAGIASAAVLACVLSARSHELTLVLIAAVLDPILVTADSVLEAAWYERLRAKVDFGSIAAAFE